MRFMFPCVRTHSIGRCAVSRNARFLRLAHRGPAEMLRVQPPLTWGKAPHDAKARRPQTTFTWCRASVPAGGQGSQESAPCPTGASGALASTAAEGESRGVEALTLGQGTPRQVFSPHPVPQLCLPQVQLDFSPQPPHLRRPPQEPCPSMPLLPSVVRLLRRKTTVLGQEALGPRRLGGRSRCACTPPSVLGDVAAPKAGHLQRRHPLGGPRGVDQV